MGFWKSLFGDHRPSKNDLIRSLAKQRVREDPLASTMGFNENMVDSLGIMQLSGLPESTVVTIVETYAALKKHSVSDSEIFARIEAHRSSIGSGEIPNPLNLESYIQYRIGLEHSHGAQISKEFVAEAISVCRQHFDC